MAATYYGKVITDAVPKLNSDNTVNTLDVLTSDELDKYYTGTAVSGGIKQLNVNGDANPLDFLTYDELALYHRHDAVDDGIKLLKDDNVTQNHLNVLTTAILNTYYLTTDLPTDFVLNEGQLSGADSPYLTTAKFNKFVYGTETPPDGATAVTYFFESDVPLDVVPDGGELSGADSPYGI